MSYTRNADRLLKWLTRYKVTVQQLVAGIPIDRQRGSTIKSAIIELLAGEGDEDNTLFKLFLNDKFDSLIVIVVSEEGPDERQFVINLDGEIEDVNFELADGEFIGGIGFTTPGRGESAEDRVYVIVRQGEGEELYNVMQDSDAGMIAIEDEGLFSLSGEVDFFFAKADSVVNVISDYGRTGQLLNSDISGFESVSILDLEYNEIDKVYLTDGDDSRAYEFFVRELGSISGFSFQPKSGNTDVYGLTASIFQVGAEDAFAQMKFEQSEPSAALGFDINTIGVNASSYDKLIVSFQFAPYAVSVEFPDNGIDGDVASGYGSFEFLSNDGNVVRTGISTRNGEVTGVGLFDLAEIASIRVNALESNDILYDLQMTIYNANGDNIYDFTFYNTGDVLESPEFAEWWSQVGIENGYKFSFLSSVVAESVELPVLSNVVTNYNQGRIFVDSTGDSNLIIRDWVILNDEGSIIIQSNSGQASGNQSNINTQLTGFPDWANPGLQNGTYYLRGTVFSSGNQVVGDTEAIEFVWDNAIITDITFNSDDETFKMSFDTKGRTVGCIQILNDYNGASDGNVNMAQVCGFGQYSGLILNGVYEDYDTTMFNLNLTPYDPGDYYITLYMDDSGYSNWFRFTKPGVVVEPDVPTITSMTSDGSLIISANSNGKVCNGGKIYNDDMTEEVGNVSFAAFLGVKSFTINITDYNNGRGLANGTYNLTLRNVLGESDPTEFILDNPTIDSVVHDTGSLVATFDTKGKTVSCIFIFTDLPANGGYPIVTKCGNISPALTGSYTDHDLSINGLNTSTLVVGQTYYIKMEFQTPGYTDYIPFTIEEPI